MLNSQELNENKTSTEQKEIKGFGYGILLILIILLVSIPFSIICMYISNNIYKLNSSLITLFSFIPTMLVSYLIACKIWDSKKIDLSPVPLNILLILIPTTISLGIIIDSLASLIPMPQEIEKMFENAFSLDFAGFLTIVISAPILEELIFRGVILKNFLKKYSPQKAIILSALLFGICHLNPWQFIGAFILGCVMGWIYYNTKSILSTIFIHFINNGFVFGLGFLYKDINVTFKDIVGGTTNFILLIILCVIILTSTTYYLLKKYNKNIILLKKHAHK